MRGAGCIVKLKVTDRPKPERVVVPVRGAGCITATQGEKFILNVAVPVRGTGCIELTDVDWDGVNQLLST